MNTNHTIITYVLLVTCIILPCPCYAEPIKIGAMLCLTGSCAPDGHGALNGINLAIKELTAKHFQGRKFAAVHPFLLEQAKAEFEGTIYNTFQVPGAEFGDRYLQKYKEKPLVSAGTGYDAIQVLNAAILGNKEENSLILRDRIRKTVLKGAFGEVRFDENRCVVREPAALKVERGEIVPFTMDKFE